VPGTFSAGMHFRFVYCFYVVHLVPRQSFHFSLNMLKQTQVTILT